MLMHTSSKQKITRGGKLFRWGEALLNTGMLTGTVILAQISPGVVGLFPMSNIEAGTRDPISTHGHCCSAKISFISHDAVDVHDW